METVPELFEMHVRICWICFGGHRIPNKLNCKILVWDQADKQLAPESELRPTMIWLPLLLADACIIWFDGYDKM